jgi:hypothetical protein
MVPDPSVSLKDVITAINAMRRDGVIERYSIGGAVGATFYLEPVATLDVDVFVGFAHDRGRLTISPQPVFDYLKARGASVEGEYLVIAGWPVQFLPPTSPLVEEALATAREFDVEGETAFVFSAEHLAAIALQTGRAKDKARLGQFVESGALDATLFDEIIERHGLSEKWRRIEPLFVRDPE